MVGRYPKKFGSNSINSNTDIAKAFNQQFTNASNHVSDKLWRKTICKIAKFSLADNPTFSPQQTKQAIEGNKHSAAFDRDGLCNVHSNTSDLMHLIT